MAKPVEVRFFGVIRHCDFLADDTNAESDTLWQLVSPPSPDRIGFCHLRPRLALCAHLGKVPVTKFLSLAVRLELWTQLGVMSPQ
jgi:hypothetical protein